MESQYLVLGATFIAFTGGVWALMSMFGRKESRASERLADMKDPFARQRRESSSQQSTAVSSMIERAAPALSKALESKSELEQSHLKIRLANAGFNNQNASRNFLAIKVIALFTGLMFGGGYSYLMSTPGSNSWMSLVFGAGLGFYLPEIGLAILRADRQGKIFLQLPDALDLLVVCVEAGLGLDAAMRRVSEEMMDGSPEVCSELSMANMHLQMGKPRREVLHDLGVRTGVDDVRALAAILIQADKFGSSVAQALRVQSDSMRVKRRQMAEEKAQQSAVKMIFPLVLFIFPGIFVVLVGPASIQLMENLTN
ncbi:MAG: type II secretion system F family protein [Planctomyces sp.]|nr:type II secretion system F family protein [Planctomyces sp.]